MVLTDELCQPLSSTPCIDTALLISDPTTSATDTSANTEVLCLSTIPIPYVAFQQLFFKNKTYSQNKILTNTSDIFNAYISNKNRLVANIDGCPEVGEDPTMYNTLQQMTALYEKEAESLSTCWDKCSKIKFTKDIAKIKSMFDVDTNCRIDCALNVDDMFCALEAADCDNPVVIDEETNMPTANLTCELPDLNENVNQVILDCNKFVYVKTPDERDALCQPAPLAKVVVSTVECGGCHKVDNIIAKSNLSMCSSSYGGETPFSGVGTVLISAYHIDGILGGGGQYALTRTASGEDWDVKYWEQSAIINITTRISGSVPVLSGGTKSVYLDVVWKYKVDLTPASSGSGGFDYTAEYLYENEIAELELLHAAAQTAVEDAQLEVNNYAEENTAAAAAAAAALAEAQTAVDIVQSEVDGAPGDTALEDALAVAQTVLDNAQSEVDNYAEGSQTFADALSYAESQHLQLGIDLDAMNANAAAAVTANHKSASGWSQTYKRTGRMSDDRQRKCIPRKHSTILMTSMQTILDDHRQRWSQLL